MNFHILYQTVLCQHQQTTCPLLVVTLFLPLWTNMGFKWDAVFDKWTMASLKKSCMSVLPPALISLSYCDSLFPSSSPSLSFSSLSILLAPSGSVRHNCVSWEIISSWPCSRSSDIFHLSSIFYPLPFFLSPTPSFPWPSFFLSAKSFSSLIPYKRTNRISISQKEKKNGKRKKVRGWDKIAFSIRVNSEKIEKYRYASKVKMRKEVERKINTFMCTHTTRCVLWMGPTYKTAIYLYTITATLHSEVSLNTRVSLPVRRKRGHKTTSFTKRLFDLDAPANAFWLTQSVPLASMLLEATRSFAVWCNGQSSGLLIRRQHRRRVYCPRRWLDWRPTALLHLGLPFSVTFCHLCIWP